MSFIGIVSDSKKFDILKKLVQKNMNKNQYTLININRKSISNLKNVKFDVIIFLEIQRNLKNEYIYLQEICKGVRYLAINSDIKLQNNLLQNIETNIITFGLNHLSTITFSSVTDDNILISVQRSFQKFNGEIMEVGEYNFTIEKYFGKFLYEVLACFFIQ